jgi:hypothetical protein
LDVEDVFFNAHFIGFIALFNRIGRRPSNASGFTEQIQATMRQIKFSFCSWMTDYFQHHAVLFISFLLFNRSTKLNGQVNKEINRNRDVA